MSGMPDGPLTLETNYEMQITGNQKLKLANQSLAFGAFRDNEKLSVLEITERVNETLGPDEKLSERTIRRAVNELVSKKLLARYARERNAHVFGVTASFAPSSIGSELIPLKDGLASVEDFVRAIADPAGRPLKRKQNLLAEKTQHAIRRLMLAAVFSAGESGHDSNLKQISATLYEAVDELKYVQKFIEAFLSSPIWYSQYRDGVALEIRELQRNNPELFQLAQEYMKSER